MNLYKLLKLVAVLLSVIGIIALVLVISAGDEAFETGEKTWLFDFIATIAYITLIVILVFVTGFVLKNIITNTSNLKNTLIGIGAFIGVIIVAYLFSIGDTEQYKMDDGFATDGQSTLVSTGLITFYFLLGIAAIIMIYAGAKKIINKY